MPLQLARGLSTVLMKKPAFERSGITRAVLDARYNLTDDEFRVEDGLIAIGPLPSDDLLSQLITDLEEHGLIYFDDFFELSGNWPEWLTVYVRTLRAPKS